jgi:hypothetical protein
MALPVFRSKAATNYSTRGSPINVTKPAGTVQDDIILAVGALGHPDTDIGTDISPPDGTWTAVRAPTAIADTGHFEVIFHVWWKRAGASEPASYDFTQNAGANRNTEVCLASYSGCITSGSPIDSGIAATSGTSNSATIPSITTTVDDALLIIADQNWDAANTHVPPTGFVERNEFLTTINDAGQATAGASGSKGPYNPGTLSGPNPWQAWMFALKPVASAVVPYTSRDYAFGGLLGGGYLIDRGARDFAMLGAYVAQPTAVTVTGGRAKVWNGSAWVEKPAKVWNGSAWVEKPVKFWNGSSWVLA